MLNLNSNIWRRGGSALRTFASGLTGPRKTALHGLHVELGGKMVDFAGYSLPVQYTDGIIASHLHTRSSASLFDVSHMGQLRLHGAHRAEFLESLVVGDIKSLQPQEARLTLLTNERGGIVDDCIVTCQDRFLSVVVNAACADKDIAHIKAHLAAAQAKGLDVSLEVLEDHALVALQGPEAMGVLGRLIAADGKGTSQLNLERLPFMAGVMPEQLLGAKGCTVTRCGYTGEDGFEISVPNGAVERVARAILADPAVKPAGLGARDSLRLEAGLCLYGHDVDENTTPVEAALAWAIGKRRRTEGGFPGFAVISEQLANGVARKRVGLNVTGAPAREGARLLQPVDGGQPQQIGLVTSGAFSPSLSRPIAMGYVATALAKPGTKLLAEVRDKRREAEVVKTPFVPAHYYKVP